MALNEPTGQTISPLDAAVAEAIRRVLLAFRIRLQMLGGMGGRLTPELGRNLDKGDRDLARCHNRVRRLWAIRATL